MTARDRKTIKFPIFYQILLTMCVVALIPMVGLWYISIYDSTREWTANISQSLDENTESLGYSVEQWTTANLRILEQNAATPAIRGMQDGSQDAALETISETYSWIYLAFTVRPNGENLGRSDGNPQTFYGDRDYFRQVMDGADLGRQVVMGKTSKKPALILAKPIKGANAKMAGVIAIAMTLEDLSKTITKTRIGQTGFAILLDEANRLIAHGDGEVSSELQDFSDHPALHVDRDAGTAARALDYNGKRIVAHAKTLDQGWTLILQQDHDEAYAAANAALTNALLLLGVTLLAVVIIALLLARRMSTPIRHLTALADEISRGKLDAEIVETGRNDEIGALARGIERMRVSLQMALERLRKR